MDPSSKTRTPLSQEARAHLWSLEVFDGLETLVKKAGGGEDAVTALHAQVIALCEGERSDAEVVTAIESLFKMDEGKAKALLDEIVTSLIGGGKGEEGAKGDRGRKGAQRGTEGAEGAKGDKGDEGEEEEKEIAQIREQRAAVLIAPAPHDIHGIVAAICQNPAFQFQDTQLQDRCAKIVESRVREVRSAEQTRAQLERARDQGGLGVTGRALADMLQALEAALVRYQENLVVKQEQEKAAVKETRRAREAGKEDLARREETLMAKRYTQLTGSVPRERIAPVAPSSARVSASLSAHQEIQEREGKIDAQKVRAVVAAAKAAESKPPRVAANPSMQEIAFGKRLAGPVEELRTLGLLDFRRLSKDPRQAATKVKDKIDLLEGDGYDKKIEGIKAWRSSPLNRLYMDLARDAVLKGATLDALLSQRTKAREETLTDEELKAIIALNGELRF